MTHSEQINEIAAALSKAQGEIQNVVKDAKNPHFKSDYATLDAITDAVRPVFAKHGLAVVQIPTFADGLSGLDSLITHTSGQWIRGYSAAPIPKADPQGVGSATTYLRRYSLAGIAQIAQTDDDGNAASSNGAKKAPDGFVEWVTDLEAVSDDGTAALQDAWKKSPAALRTFLTTHQNARWEALKARAAKVRSVRSEAAKNA
jgi:hypothetical protein